VETKLDVAVRQLTMAEVEAFRDCRAEGLKVHPEAFGEDYDEFMAKPLDEIAKRLDPADGAFILGALVNDQLVGVIGHHRKPGKKNRHQAIIWGVYVSGSQRGTGLGRLLMEAAIAKSRALGDVEELQLTVITCNTSAIALYESLGFKTYGVEPKALKLGTVYYEEALMHLALA
jgi:ribosomal protein S18 acetylase RimI-like enzyme